MTAEGTWESRIPLLVRLQDVRRFSVRRIHHQQSVAEHCFNVVWIYFWIRERIGWPPTVNAIADVVCHDMDEALTGDVPAPAKGEGGIDYSIWGADRLLFKLADKLEQWLFLARERRLGNRSLDDVERTTMVVLVDLIAQVNAHALIAQANALARECRFELLPKSLPGDLVALAFQDIEQEVGQYESRTEEVP